MGYEPTKLDTMVTKFMLMTPGKAIYKSFAKKLEIAGDEIVMDFGCGYGTVAKFIAKELHNGHLVCLDTSTKWIELCEKHLKKYSNTSFYDGDIYKYQGEYKEFDKIYAHFVLHDIKDKELEKIIPTFTKLIKAGGKIYFREPLEFRSKVEKIIERLEKEGFRKEKTMIVNVPQMGKCIEGIFIK